MLRAATLCLGFALCCSAVDPVLRFSTYLGGTGRDLAPETAVAADGSVYVAMATDSPDIASSPDAAQKALAPGTCYGGDPEGGSFPRRCFDVYIAKFNPSGEILRSTFIGGGGDDFISGIRLDRAGNVWLAGNTGSADFPRAKIIGTPPNPFAGGFIVELSPDLGSILQSTVIIGAPPLGFTLDAAGAAYIVGRTGSAGLPTVNAIQAARTPGVTYADGFIVKLAPGGTLAYSTYYGGSGDTTIVSVAVDSAGAAVLAGYTQGADLPGGGARYGSRAASADVFVAKLAVDGKSTDWVRFLGGSGFDSLGAMALDTSGSIYAAGITSSPDYEGDDFSGTNPNGSRGFLTKLSGNGASVLSSRLFGYYPQAIAVNAPGAIWVTGVCCSGLLKASSSALQLTRNGYQTDAYLVELGETGPPLWASYIGGTGADSGTSVSITADGVVLAGATQSFDFPLNDAVQSSLHQNPGVSPVLEDAFVMRFGTAATVAPAFTETGITNAASYRSGEAAPGSIVSIFGNDLSSLVRQAGSLPLPTTLGDTSVTVNGIAAPLYYVSPSQINLQVPFETAIGPAEIVVSRAGLIGPARELPIVPASPGLFLLLNGYAAINAPSTYVRGGDWITLYATGLGAVDGASVTGEAPPNPPPQVKAPVLVTLGDMQLEVTWAGLAPGFAGLYQVNAQLPADVGTGYKTLPLVVSTGGKSSNSGAVGVLGQ